MRRKMMLVAAVLICMLLAPTMTMAAHMDGADCTGHPKGTCAVRRDLNAEYAEGLPFYEFLRSNPVVYRDPTGTTIFVEKKYEAEVKEYLGKHIPGAEVKKKDYTFKDVLQGRYTAGLRRSQQGRLFYCEKEMGIRTTTVAATVRGRGANRVTVYTGVDKSEILSRMIESKRVFWVNKGKKGLEAHVQARFRVAAAALRVSATSSEEQREWFEGCTLAANRIVEEAPGRWSAGTQNLGWDDLIPGDSGYIVNKPIPRPGQSMMDAARQRPKLLEGENVVYVGNGLYYAWPYSGLSTLDEVENRVAAWGKLPGAQPGEKARAGYRNYPYEGLKGVEYLSQVPGMYLADTKDAKGGIPLAEEPWMRVPGTR